MPYKDRQTRLAYYRRYDKARYQKRRQDQHFYSTSHHANVRAKKYGAEGIITATVVRLILHSEAHCYYCGRTREQLPLMWGRRELEIDHVIPLYRGGKNAKENLVPCCHPCNASKWRGDRPYRWSRKNERCQRCGTTERKHSAGGYCDRCYRWLHYKKVNLEC